MNPQQNILTSIMKTAQPVFLYMGLFSFFINILLLLVPIYSLQVLDRVLSTGSMETLLWLSVVVVIAFVAAGIIQALRSFVLIRAGQWVEENLGRTLLSLSLTSAANTGARGTQNLRDLGTIKTFLAGSGLLTLFDAPWSIIYLLVIFVIHFELGVITLLGCIILLALAWLNEIAMQKPLSEANETNIRNLLQVDIAMRNAEAIEAMGMNKTVVEGWHGANQKVSFLQNLASYRSGVIQAITKTLRLALQVAIIGWGAYLAVHHEMTPGGIIAASILAGRALSPFEAAISTWKSVVETRKSYERIKTSLAAMESFLPGISLPEPSGQLTVENLVYGVANRARPVLKNISFSLDAGDILGIIGPSAAGKSTLAKLIIGTWRPYSGVVRLDGSDVCKWKREEFGRHVGYLPQDIELFSGTVKDNIARMDSNAPDEAIIKAAQETGAHEFIMMMPDGYNTDIGPGGSSLSAGQRQRIGLARAFFGKPKLLVLDEPDASLDAEGENALAKALQSAQIKKITTIIITHKKSMMKYFSKMLVVQDGETSLFGPAQQVLQQMLSPTRVAT